MPLDTGRGVFKLKEYVCFRLLVFGILKFWVFLYQKKVSDKSFNSIYLCFVDWKRFFIQFDFEKLAKKNKSPFASNK